MDLRECTRNEIIKRTKVNTSLVQSLIEMSAIKENVIKKVDLDEVNINAFIPMAYDSMRELLEAYCVLHGFKVLNHDCLGKLCKELFSKFDLILFDRLRYIRNGINYYGEKISFSEGNIIIKNILGIKQEMLKETQRLLKNIP